MDSFEQIVAMLLQREGYWVHTSYKVCLTKAEKVKIGIPSSPRWEVDVVAYRPKDNRVLAVECKSFLNSPGVSFPSFSGKSAKGAKTYKLFTQAKLRKTVLSRLRKQLKKEGRVARDCDVTLCLAAGHLRKGHADAIQEHCVKNGWLLFADRWFQKKFEELAGCAYENDIAIVAAKLAKVSFDPNG